MSVEQRETIAHDDLLASQKQAARTGQRSAAALEVPAGYEDLAAILQEALDQSSKGKGKERHQQADRPFDRQPICELPRMVGPQGTAYQVMKKTQEAMRLPPDRACAELLGAIVYAAATIKIIRENTNAG